jgi:hypothetical protein
LEEFLVFDRVKDILAVLKKIWILDLKWGNWALGFHALSCKAVLEEFRLQVLCFGDEWRKWRLALNGRTSTLSVDKCSRSDLNLLRMLRSSMILTHKALW